MTVLGTESFYPSCVVNLTLMFEAQLQVNVREEGGNQSQQLVSKDQSSTFLLNRVPKKCSVHLQGHTQAATYKLVFDYKELPIDPRTVVACSVEIHLGTVSATDFSEGMQRTLPNGQRRSILVTRDATDSPVENNLLMVGPADTWTAEFGPDGAEVHLEGRDLRGLLLDSPLVSFADVYDESPVDTDPTHRGMPRRRRRQATILSRLKTNLPIDDVVRQILEEHDVIRELPKKAQVRVKVYPEEWPDQKLLSPGEGAILPRNRRGANGQRSNAGGTSGSLNFWDLITRVCYLVGAVPKFVGRTLEIRHAPSLFRLVSQDNQMTPFWPNERRRLGGDTWAVRRLVWGRDVQSMKISRKYAGINKPHSIRVVAADTSNGRRGRDQMLQVVWPPRNVREARAQGVGWRPLRDAVGGQESQEIRTYRVPGVRSIAHLTQIAQALYEQIGRQEMTGDIEAARVTSFGGTNADPDLLRLRVGDPIELLVDASRLDTSSPIVSTLNANSQEAFSTTVQQVARHLNGNTGLARVIVATNRGNIMGALRYFLVSSVNFDWSYEEVTVKADVQNYIIYRWGETERQSLSNARRHHGTRAARRTNSGASSTTGPSAVAEPAAASRSSAVSTPVSAADRAVRSPFDVMESDAEAAASDRPGMGDSHSRWR